VNPPKGYAKDSPYAGKASAISDANLKSKIANLQSIAFPKLHRPQAFLFKEDTVKVGKGFKAALVGNGSYRPVRFGKQVAGMPYPYIVYIVRKGFAGSTLKELAKGTFRKMH
jgi:hypothetical protein